jgi:hypothetical protein
MDTLLYEMEIAVRKNVHQCRREICVKRIEKVAKLPFSYN